MVRPGFPPVPFIAALLVFAVSAAGAQTPGPVPTPGKTQVLIPKSKGKKKPKKIPYEKRINLNTASREELMKVPTIDAATADRIIAGRPYKMTAELLLKKIVPGAHFWTVKELVTAGPVAPGKPAAGSGKAPPAKK